jgi:4-amino-4-deoxy-L-arabinose transferase-like glycosyltransferase
VAVLRPGRLLAVGAVLLVLGFQLGVTPRNPPGFLDDEAAFALNGYTLAHGLRDQSGAFAPVFVPSFGDYKNAAFSYVLAPAMALFGPSKEAARWVAALFGLAAVLLVGALGYRRSGAAVGIAAAVGAGLTPWLFQLGRLAVDTCMFPFAVALVLFVCDGWARSARRSLLWSVALGASLAFLTYSYSAGRLLGVLLAAALVFFVRSVPWSALFAAAASYCVLLIPLGVYALRHPAGLTARYHETAFPTTGMTTGGIVAHAFANYLHDLNPWHWVVSGDRKPYVDVWGTPQLLAAVALLAAVGVLEIVLRHRRDPFWWYVVAAYLVSPIPAALTVDRHQALRLAAMPLCVAVLAIPGIAAVARLHRPLLPVAAAALAAAALAEWAFFVVRYTERGPHRGEAFEAGVALLAERALAGGRTVFVDHDDPYALTMGRWYAVAEGLPPARVVRLADGGVPPVGSVVLGRVQACDFPCLHFAEADTFWLARVEPGSGT